MTQGSDYGLWVGIVVSVFIHVGGGYAWLTFTQSNEPAIKLDAIQAAVLVRKGKPRPKHLLPRIYQKKQPTAKRKKIVEKKKKKKTRKKKRRRRRRVAKEPDLDDIINRTMKRRKRDPRAENSAAPGQANGSTLGTAQKARIGNMYAAKVTAKISQELDIPTVLSAAQRKECRRTVLVRVYISRSGTNLKRKLKVIQKYNNRLCMNAILNAINKVSEFDPPPSALLGSRSSLYITLNFTSSR